MDRERRADDLIRNRRQRGVALPEYALSLSVLILVFLTVGYLLVVASEQRLDDSVDAVNDMTPCSGVLNSYKNDGACY